MKTAEREDLVHPETGERGQVAGFFGYDRPILSWDVARYSAVLLATQHIPRKRLGKPYVVRKPVTFEYSGETVRQLAAAMRKDGWCVPRGLGRLCYGNTR